jgi:hypothetical protein
MRVIAPLLLFCTLSDSAMAQTAQCQSIPKASDRLACYDKAAPPTAVGKPTASRTPALSNSSSQTPPADLLATENSKLDAKIKGICRGC